MRLRDEDVRDLTPLVRGIVGRHFRNVPDTVADADDLFQCGMLAVMRAADRYDPSRGVPFTAWAAQSAHRGILDALRALQPGSRRGKHLQTLSLDAPAAEGHDEFGTLADVLADDEFDFGDPLQAAQVERALRELTLDTQSALALRFEEDLQLGEIADLLGVTESRVSQLVSRGLEQLAVALA